ncbi:MAG TPA: MqnA/MqnD/SBP family protein [Methylomirabilota bacterium]|jgi:1,4-dihydroxy-6-naphthoate synthase|nr:MqnA/MqnD/SBP family protein [Methylomirabilota bacterium]
MRLVRIGHSPDADDAFMFYALTHGKVEVPGVRVEHVLEDIESLNRRAATGELEVTAISCATYPAIADRYRLMDAGASMGKGYGPIVVAKQPYPEAALAVSSIAVPGLGTTAYLLLRLALGDPPVIVVPFDRIIQVVVDEQAHAGLLIHEGQITYSEQRLTKVMDLGERWTKETGLPLPLGVNVTRRDLGEDLARQLSDALRASIRYAHAHPDEAVGYALRYGRGIDAETCRKFVEMYVNDYTVTLGEEGRRALETLYRQAVKRDLLAALPPIDPL